LLEIRRFCKKPVGLAVSDDFFGGGWADPWEGFQLDLRGSVDINLSAASGAWCETLGGTWYTPGLGCCGDLRLDRHPELVAIGESRSQVKGRGIRILQQTSGGFDSITDPAAGGQRIDAGRGDRAFDMDQKARRRGRRLECDRFPARRAGNQPKQARSAQTSQNPERYSPPGFHEPVSEATNQRICDLRNNSSTESLILLNR
jgi:hypothetical protein